MYAVGLAHLIHIIAIEELPQAEQGLHDREHDRRYELDGEPWGELRKAI